jgi:hypothetical protein
MHLNATYLYDEGKLLVLLGDKLFPYGSPAVGAVVIVFIALRQYQQKTLAHRHGTFASGTVKLGGVKVIVLLSASHLPFSKSFA